MRQAKRMKTIVRVSPRVNYDGCYMLIVPDASAGSSQPRYTVYRVPASPPGEIRIIGRELPIGLAKKVAEREQ